MEGKKENIDKQKPTITQMSLNIATGVITAAVIGAATLVFTSFRDKISRQEFNTMCIQNKAEHARLQKQYDNQVAVNAELLKAMNSMNIKLERVETNTEWLIKQKQ